VCSETARRPAPDSPRSRRGSPARQGGRQEEPLSAKPPTASRCEPRAPPQRKRHVCTAACASDRLRTQLGSQLGSEERRLCVGDLGPKAVPLSHRSRKKSLKLQGPAPCYYEKKRESVRPQSWSRVAELVAERAALCQPAAPQGHTRAGNPSRRKRRCATFALCRIRPVSYRAKKRCNACEGCGQRGFGLLPLLDKHDARAPELYSEAQRATASRTALKRY
jgi:hypothetical protein